MKVDHLPLYRDLPRKDVGHVPDMFGDHLFGLLIREDQTVEVRYTPNTYRITIQYITIDGTTAAEPYTADVQAGEAYRLYAKPIAEYRPLKQRISGTNPGRDEEYTAIYVPEGETAELILMEDYEQASHMEGLGVQTGICFE